MSELTLDPALLSELSTQNQEQLHSHQNQKDAIQISWAQNDNEIKEAQQLRYKVFAEEMGAHLASNYEKVDKDVLDQYCDHLLIRDKETIKEWKLAHPDVPKAQEKTLPLSNSAKRLIDLNKGYIGQF